MFLLTSTITEKTFYTLQETKLDDSKITGIIKRNLNIKN